MPKSTPLVAAILKSFQVSMDGCRVGLATTLEDRLGLRLRHAEAERAIIRLGEPVNAAWDERRQGVVLFERVSEAFLEALATALAEIASRPLTPRLVTQALDITNQERLRWTKDGRLPTSGRAQIRGSAPVNFATYAVEDVESLVCDPKTIANWRIQDRTPARANGHQGAAIGVGGRHPH